MDNIIFENDKHKAKYISLLQKVGLTTATDNTEFKSVMYLLALIGKNENDLFDFDEKCIKPDGIYSEWQTGSTTRASRLLFILWNDYPSEPEQANNSISNIFGYTEWDKYFIEAIKIKYPYTTA